MPRLRAIGGPRDGEWLNAPAHLRQNDLMPVPELINATASRLQHGPPEEMSLAYRAVYYRLQHLRFWDGGERAEIAILVYEKWKLPDALERVLTEWGPTDAAE